MITSGAPTDAALISICIPCFERPEFLRSAIASVVSQSYRPIEIVVRDDSSDDRSEAIVSAFASAEHPDVTWRYARNRPRAGQNDNVNLLFDDARGARLVLLHDDDALMPDALATLAACWERFPELVIAYGRQAIIADDGCPMPELSRELDVNYSRVAARAGKISSLLDAALRHQIPSDGFMIRSDVARLVRYRDYETIGVYCDTDFSIRVGIEFDLRGGYFIDRPLSLYRYSSDAISSDARAKSTTHPTSGLALYRFVKGLRVSPELEDARLWQLRHVSDKALKGLAYAGKRGEAIRLYLSSAYPMRRRASRKGLYHLALIASPSIDRLRSYGKIRRRQR